MYLRLVNYQTEMKQSKCCSHIWVSAGCLSQTHLSNYFSIRNNIKLAQLIRAQECPSRGHRFASGKNLKPRENSNLYGFELHRPSSKSTKLLLQVIKAIINLGDHNWSSHWFSNKQHYLSILGPNGLFRTQRTIARLLLVPDPHGLKQFTIFVGWLASSS